MKSGHWNLFRYDPRQRETGDNPLTLDSRKPKIPYREFAKTEMRFGILMRTHPEVAKALQAQAQREVNERHDHYEQLAGLIYPATGDTDDDSSSGDDSPDEHNSGGY